MLLALKNTSFLLCLQSVMGLPRVVTALSIISHQIFHFVARPLPVAGTHAVLAWLTVPRHYTAQALQCSAVQLKCSGRTTSALIITVSTEGCWLVTRAPGEVLLEDGRTLIAAARAARAQQAWFHSCYYRLPCFEPVQEVAAAL